MRWPYFWDVMSSADVISKIKDKTVKEPGVCLPVSWLTEASDEAAEIKLLSMLDMYKWVYNAQ
ncbi:hypothetical protein NC653_034105 [Populus alba x Populus x berolinensis]|uniref:Uncharacterized protein n=1 Tax=Populus alba x Populus x berolinensis TaxID=444605 RepID=A0AAD6PXE7_9ROSI|nr:hypothetical protein NC653_034105 [Populus alba x Populus x berolinensis]